MFSIQNKCSLGPKSSRGRVSASRVPVSSRFGDKAPRTESWGAGRGLCSRCCSFSETAVGYCTLCTVCTSIARCMLWGIFLIFPSNEAEKDLFAGSLRLLR